MQIISLSSLHQIVTNKIINYKTKWHTKKTCLKQGHHKLIMYLKIKKTKYHMVACSRWRTHPTHGLTHAVLACAKGVLKLYTMCQNQLSVTLNSYITVLFTEEKKQEMNCKGGDLDTLFFFVFVFVFESSLGHKRDIISVTVFCLGG